MVRVMKHHNCTQYLLNIYRIMNIKCSFLMKNVNKDFIKHLNAC